MALDGPHVVRAQKKAEGRRWVVETVPGSPATIKSIVYDPLDAALGCTTVQVPMTASLAFARMRAEAAAPQVSVYNFSGRQELIAAEDGLLAELGPVPGLDDVPGNLKSPYWAAFALVAEGLIYRTDKITTPPHSYKDLLRPEYAGHVAYPELTNGYGADTLVMLARTYGGTERNIDPGFRALAEFAKTATFFKVASELPPLFAQEDIWIAPYDIATAIRCQQAGLPVAYAAPEEGIAGITIVVCMPKDGPDADLARDAVARFLSADTQRQLAEQLHWVPTIDNPGLSEPLQRELPRPRDFVPIDQRYVTAQLPTWIDRWNRDIAK